MRTLRVLLGLSVCAMMPALAQADSIKFQSAQEQTALLELYTSEGCSSCPPAEAWMSRLQESPRLWKDFAPVAFHVEYWDSLGWKDVWSSEEYSDRQRAYAQAWHSDNIYTPCFVLNGKEWHNWLTRKNGPSSDPQVVGILTVTSTDTNRWQAAFAPGNPDGADYEIHAALLAGGITSDVKAGENEGRRLGHDFLVANLVQMGMTTTGSVAKGKFILDTPKHNSGKTLALTVWVTRAGELEPLQTTGGWLIPPVKK